MESVYVSIMIFQDSDDGRQEFVDLLVEMLAVGPPVIEVAAVDVTQQEPWPLIQQSIDVSVHRSVAWHVHVCHLHLNNWRQFVLLV